LGERVAVLLVLFASGRRGEREVFYLVRAADPGLKGLGRKRLEAVQRLAATLGWKRLVAKTLAENGPTIKVLKEAGFRCYRIEHGSDHQTWRWYRWRVQQRLTTASGKDSAILVA